MKFYWLNFIATAEKLYEDARVEKCIPEAEAMYRSSISRAYYASHHFCRKYLELFHSEKFDGDGSIHWAVINKLKDIGGDAEKASKSLKTLKVARDKADYEIETGFADLSIFTKSMIDRAGRVVKKICPLIQ